MPAHSRKKESAPKPVLRSPCPVAFCLDVIGDRWTMLVIRDLVLGSNRFREFSESPEHIPTNILSNRLERLQTHRLIAKIPASDGTKWQAYELTDKGRALLPILQAMRDWGLAWNKETRVLRRAQ